MTTLTRSSYSLNSASSPLWNAVNLPTELFPKGSSLNQKTARLQNRSSVTSENSMTSKAASITRLAVFQGRSPSVLQVTGNGTRNTTGIQQMHNGSAWEFFSNGAFRFTPAGLGTIARTDLFPIVGRYQQTNNGLSFSGSRSSSMTTSRNFASVQGSFYRSGSGFRARVTQQTVLINAAVVNGTSFGSNTNRTVTLDMAIVRIA